MDRILKQLVEDFLESFEISPEGADADFEKFTNYTIVEHEYSRDFDLNAITVGHGDDTGIDGIAIIVNGQIVNTQEDVEDLLDSNGKLEVVFIFIQAKNTSRFESSEMNNFSFGVKDFFAEYPKLRRNENIENNAALSNYIFGQASNFRENPDCRLYYVTTGNWSTDQNNVAIIESTKQDLQNLGMFSQISFLPLGSNEIAKYYRDTKNARHATFTFSEKVTLPELPQIKEAYYGIVPLYEFKKLILDENNNLLNIFDDNVRDFQGLNNPINKTIAETLTNNFPQLFTVLNNGVTIVASDLKKAGNKFTVVDYQIVNGCQTSNVLYEHSSNSELQDLRIPVRLIVTDNDEVKNKITIATNSQTAIKREQLQAMKDFQKNLESFYNTMDVERLYYERRTRQYQTNSSVIKSRVITIQNQIKAFGSMYLDIPHRVTTYFGQVVRQHIENEKPTIFNPSHQFLPYYTAGLAYFRLDSLFRSKEIDTDYRRVKWFLIMLVGKLANPNPLNFSKLNSDKYSSEYCNPVIDILYSKEKSLDLFNKAIDVFKETGIDLKDKQGLKATSVTDKVLAVYKNNYSHRA